MITRAARPAASVQRWSLASRQDTANGRIAACTYQRGMHWLHLALKRWMEAARVVFPLLLRDRYQQPSGLTAAEMRRRSRTARRARVLADRLATCPHTGPPAAAVADSPELPVISP